MLTQSATKDGGALASWRMEAPPSDCVSMNSRPSARLESSYFVYTRLFDARQGFDDLLF